MDALSFTDYFNYVKSSYKFRFLRKNFYSAPFLWIKLKKWPEQLHFHSMYLMHVRNRVENLGCAILRLTSHEVTLALFLSGYTGILSA